MELAAVDAASEFPLGLLFQFRQSLPNTQILRGLQAKSRPDTSKMDKIAGLKEILALDPKNSFARYGIAMELAGRGETEAALAEFSTLLANDPDYTAGYFMAAQTLAGAGTESRGDRTAEGRHRMRHTNR